MQEELLTLLADRTFRTGRQRLWIDVWGDYFVSLTNRTYETFVPIPPEKAPVWMSLLN